MVLLWCEGLGTRSFGETKFGEFEQTAKNVQPGDEPGD